MATLTIPLDAFYGVLLIFLRVAAILFTVPVLDSGAVPFTFKVGLALAVSVLLLPMVDTMAAVANLSLMSGVLGILSEIAIGLTIGLSVTLLFAGIQLAGQVVGYQMGFAVANVVDPATSDQIPILAQFYYLTAMLIFLTINAHHIFFWALVDSYRVLPLFGMHISAELVGLMIKLGGDVFIVAVKVGAPLIAVMLVVSVGLGLVARTVPQMHIFIVAMPLKILIGLVVLLIVTPYLTAYLVDLFGAFRGTLLNLIRMMAQVP